MKAAVRRDLYAPHMVQPSHGHDEPSLGIVLAGEVRETTAKGEEQGRAGSIVFKPAGVIHANLFGPRGTVMLSLRSPVFPGVAALEWHWRHGSAAARLSLPLASALLEGDPFGEGEERLALLLRADGANIQAGAAAPAWLRRVRDRLHSDPCARPSVSGLAEQAGVHPVYLSRRFAICYGAPVSLYARRLRALLAAEAIAAGVPLASLASDLNFADQSHLSRVFRAEFGITAGRYRSLVRSGKR